MLRDAKATLQPKDTPKNQIVGGSGGFLGSHFGRVSVLVVPPPPGAPRTDGPSHDPAPQLLFSHGHLCQRFLKQFRLAVAAESCQI